MNAKPLPSYSVVQVKKMLDMVEAWIEAAEEMADDAMTDARRDMLEERVESLREVQDALENILA